MGGRQKLTERRTAGGKEVKQSSVEILKKVT